MWIIILKLFIYDYYRTLIDLYNELYFISFECSEVKLRLFLKISYAEEKLRKSRFKLELRL